VYVEDCAQRFRISVDELFDAIIGKVSVEKRTLEVFSSLIQSELNFAADLSPRRAAGLAHDALCKRGIFDPRELRDALLKKLEATMREKLMPEADDPEKVLSYLNIILATHPHKLHEAEKAALAKSITIYDTEEPLPELWQSDTPLVTSSRNIYGVYPEGLNTWEERFVRFLDSAPGDTALWWHRNTPYDEWSVNVEMDNGDGFYPDFIIGVKGRKTEQNALLVDTKFNYEKEPEKVLAKHQTYGRVMILTLDDAKRWMVVTWDAKREKPVAETEFSFVDLAGF